MDLSNKLLQLVDKDLWENIEESGGQPTFALSWILTWFSHDIENFEKVQLIFDACLSTHPLFCVYMTVAQIVICKEAFLEENEDCVPGGYIVSKTLRDNQEFNIDESIELGYKFFKEHPPEKVFQMINEENKGKKVKRFLFGNNSPCVKYEMEKMYLTNKKLICRAEEKREVSTLYKYSGPAMLMFGALAFVSFFSSKIKLGDEF